MWSIVIDEVWAGSSLQSPCGYFYHCSIKDDAADLVAKVKVEISYKEFNDASNKGDVIKPKLAEALQRVKDNYNKSGAESLVSSSYTEQDLGI